MKFLDIFGIRSMKNKISKLESDNKHYILENNELDKKLNHYTTLIKLGRLIEVPRKLGDSIYVIMNTYIHPEYSSEVIATRVSDTISANNIKIIKITINNYVIRPSGVYIGFDEQHNGPIEYYIKADSPNIFLNMESAIVETYSDRDKEKYQNDPFIILQKEYTVHIENE